LSYRAGTKIFLYDTDRAARGLCGKFYSTAVLAQPTFPNPACYGAYEVVGCAICGRVHLVNPVSGRVLGENKEKPAKVLQTAAL
jgi:hypothetical protein